MRPFSRPPHRPVWYSPGAQVRLPQATQASAAQLPALLDWYMFGGHVAARQLGAAVGADVGARVGGAVGARVHIGARVGAVVGDGVGAPVSMHSNVLMFQVQVPTACSPGGQEVRSGQTEQTNCGSAVQLTDSRCIGTVIGMFGFTSWHVDIVGAQKSWPAASAASATRGAKRANTLRRSIILASISPP